MNRWIGAGASLVLAIGASGAPVWGQVVERERDVTVTGPRGRSVTRSVQTERGPGFVERQVNVQRPGASYHSQVVGQRGFRPGPGFRPGFGPGPRWGWGRPPVIVENFGGGGGLPVAEALAIGGGMFGLGMLANSALNSPPPPPPGYPVATVPPNVVYNQPQPYTPGAQPQPQPTVVVDPVAEALGRLQSSHDHSRRDGCLTLGQLRDPRAVPALVDKLKNDWSREVRAAAATALGQIGDPRGVVPLERALEHDPRQVVRDASAMALSRFPRDVQMNPGATTVTAGVVTAGATATAARPNTAVATPNIPLEHPTENVPPPPTPENEAPR
jgi:hypothetical protein